MWSGFFSLPVVLICLLHDILIVYTNGGTHIFDNKPEGAPTILDPRNSEAQGNFGQLHTLLKLTQWAVNEEKIADTLKLEMKLITFEQQFIRWCYVARERETKSAQRNSINSFNMKDIRNKVTRCSAMIGQRMIRRYATAAVELRKWDAFRKVVENESRDNFVLNRRKPNGWMISDFNDREDLYMSMTAFGHFSEIYGLEPSEIETLQQVDTYARGLLTAMHAAEIGVFLWFLRKYSTSLQWLQYSNKQLSSNFADRTISADIVSSFLKVVIQQHNQDLQHFKEIHRVNHKMDGDVLLNFFVAPVFNYAHFKHLKTFRQNFFSEFRGMSQNSHSDAQYMDMCLGNIPQTSKEQRKLKCYYEQRRHPYLYLNPVKVEQLSKRPLILQFYEMVGNKASHEIQQKYRSRVKLHGLVRRKMDEGVTAVRTSAMTYIGREEPVVKGVYNLADALFGLQVWNTATYLQFAEYTYGRLCVPHSDALYGGRSSEANLRFATILYYLEVPQLGGVTPFCQAGVIARPVRGSAIFWFNLYRNGTPRFDMDHGSCPVVHGHKIIMTHFVQYIGTSKKFQCSLNQFK